MIFPSAKLTARLYEGKQARSRWLIDMFLFYLGMKLSTVWICSSLNPSFLDYMQSIYFLSYLVPRIHKNQFSPQWTNEHSTSIFDLQMWLAKVYSPRRINCLLPFVFVSLSLSLAFLFSCDKFSLVRLRLKRGASDVYDKHWTVLLLLLLLLLMFVFVVQFLFSFFLDDDWNCDDAGETNSVWVCV